MTIQWTPRITSSIVVSATPTITSGSAYASGNRFGSIMSLANVVRQDSSQSFGTCLLESIHILDKAKVSPAFEIWFFNASPTIASADKAAFDLTDANAALCIGAVSCGSVYSTSTSNAVSLGDGSLNKVMQIATGTTIYAVAIIKSAVTFASTTDVTFNFGFLID